MTTNTTDTDALARAIAYLDATTGIDESPCLCGAATVGGACTDPDCVTR